MDFKEIQELLRLVSKLGLSEVSLKEGDFKITVKGSQANSAAISSPIAVSAVPMTPVAPPMLTAPAVKEEPAPTPAPAVTVAAPAEAAAEMANLVAIKSPMVGTFYRSPSPDKPAFAKVGDPVSVGQTVCIIEAMKLFNEIESEVKGKIVKVAAEDASPVEYEQVLFWVKPD